jgi:glycosyltransferase involved in cell wall biosynthesis
MLVSIIIPNYNHSSFLKQRIDSVLSQTYQDFELIILDDCSTDISRKIIEQYRSHPKVSNIVLNQQNSGSPFRQWERGIALAKGEWIWIAESDDYAHTELLRQLVAQTGANENIVLSYCQSVEVDNENNQLRTMLWWVKDLDAYRWAKDYVNKGNSEVAEYLLYKNTIPNASAVLFKKSAYQALDSRFTTMKMCGDWLFWVQLLKKGDIAYTAQPLNFFRKHTGTTRIIDTQKKLRKRLEEELVIFQYIKQNIPAVKQQNLLNRQKQLITLYRESYTRKQIITFFCFPFIYRERFPLRWLIADYLKSKFDAFFEEKSLKKAPAKV